MYSKITKLLLALCIVVLSVLLFGCNSTYYAGAPKTAFDVDSDLKELAKYFGKADSIKKYYELKKTSGVTDDELRTARDEFIAGRLTIINIHYLQFLRKSTSDKQLLDSAVDILGIGLNIAGVSFNSAATKTLLAGIAAGVSGSKATIDKNYYFDETIPALIAAMNAQRKKALAHILQGMEENTSIYRFAQAVTDLHNYEFAGSFVGAIQAIQADAGVKETVQDTSIKLSIKRLKATKEHKEVLKLCTSGIGSLTAADLDKAKAALEVLESSTAVPPADIADAKKRLSDLVFYAEGNMIDKVYKVFRDAKIIQ